MSYIYDEALKLSAEELKAAIIRMVEEDETQDLPDLDVGLEALRDTFIVVKLNYEAVMEMMSDARNMRAMNLLDWSSYEGHPENVD